MPHGLRPGKTALAALAVAFLLGCGGSSGGLADGARPRRGAVGGDGMAGTGGSCRQTTEACAVTADCCGDLICLSNACTSAPQCRAQAAPCAVTADCCKDLICIGNACTLPPQCRASGGACAVTADCCSGLACLGGACRTPPRCGDDICVQSEVDTCCRDCGCGVGFACVNGGACVNVGQSTALVNMKNTCATTAHMHFFDPINMLTWPSGDDPYVLAPGETRSFLLGCTQDAQVCYGGGEVGGTHSWGLGIDGAGDCEDCCFDCKGGYSSLTLLTCP